MLCVILSCIILLLLGTRLALLSQLKEGDEAYDSEHREYFFDRHPKAFENILQYYRSEELHMDPSVCGNLMNKVLYYNKYNYVYYGKTWIWNL